MSNWKIKKLDELCFIELGKTPYRGNRKFWDTEKKTGNVWLSIADLQNTDGLIINDSKEYISNEGAEISKIVKRGTLLVSFKLTLGRMAFAGRDLYTNEAIAALEVKDETVIDKYFLHKYLSFFDWDEATNGDVKVKGKTLNKKKLKEIEIPVPSLSEQRRIVEILDSKFIKIDNITKNLKLNLRNSKEIFSQYLLELFEDKANEWEMKKLGDVCIVERGSSPRPIKKYLTSKSSGINWIKIGDTKGVDKYICKTKEKITEEGAKKSRFVEEGDFVLSNSMSLGKPYIMKTKGCIHDGWFVLRLPKNIDVEFFWYLLVSPFAMNQFKQLASGAIVKNISSDLVKKTLLPIPPIEVQKSVVKKFTILFDKINSLENLYKEKLKDINDIKKAILYKVFSGDLATNTITINVPPFILNQVNAAIIERVVADGGHTTDVAVAKYNHLLQELCGLPLGYQFEKHLFGPFDNKVKKMLYSGLSLKNKWFKKNYGKIVFGEKINSLLSKKSKLYEEAQLAMDDLAKLNITKLDTDKVELLSTVCHSIKETNSIEVDRIIGCMSDWQTDNNKTKAEKFTRESVESCLKFITDNKLHLKLLQI